MGVLILINAWWWLGCDAFAPLARRPDRMRLAGAQASLWGDGLMPTYEHRCTKCGKTFERTESMAEHEAAKPSCPKCGSKKVAAVPSRIYTITTKKS